TLFRKYLVGINAHSEYLPGQFQFGVCRVDENATQNDPQPQGGRTEQSSGGIHRAAISESCNSPAREADISACHASGSSWEWSLFFPSAPIPHRVGRRPPRWDLWPESVPFSAVRDSERPLPCPTPFRSRPNWIG